MRLANECGIMPYGLYISAEGAAAQSRRMQVIANNIANVDTPGFKRQLAVLEARHSEAIEVGDDAAGSASINDISGGVVLRETLDDMSPGTFKHTGVATDMAIDGDGYFQVQRDGQDLLPRPGNFFFGADGVLRTQNGETVLSSEGARYGSRPAFPGGLPKRAPSSKVAIHSSSDWPGHKTRVICRGWGRIRSCRWPKPCRWRLPSVTSAPATWNNQA